MCAERHVFGRRLGGILLRKHQVSVGGHESAETDRNAQRSPAAEPDLREGNGENRPVVLQTRPVQHGAPVERKPN